MFPVVTRKSAVRLYAVNTHKQLMIMFLFEDNSLFASGRPHTVKYDLPDAELSLFEYFFDKQEADELYNSLLHTTLWQQDNITVYGKTHLTPRLTAWYGDNGADYTFSGTRMEPYEWTPDLLRIREQLGTVSGVRFNSVLLNLYRNGQDGVGWHRDDEPELGTNPVIASVSFGETRVFQIRHKFRKDIQKVDIPLTHGSVLVMGGTMQHCWEHQVPKTAKMISPRINLTFRVIARKAM